MDQNDEAINGYFKGEKIAIIGDSISTFYGHLVSDYPFYDGIPYDCYYPRGDVKTVYDTWWGKTAQQLGISLNDINNCSWSGSKVTGNAFSTENAFAGCSLRRINDLSANGATPDIILCYISCNDWAANCPIGEWGVNDILNPTKNVSTFREAYALMLKQLRIYYPGANIFCLTCLDDLLRDKTLGVRQKMLMVSRLRTGIRI